MTTNTETPAPSPWGVFEIIIGAFSGLGFELFGASLDLFKGVQGFFCWMMTSFLDFVEAALYEGIGMLPGGGFFDLATLKSVLDLFGDINKFLPLGELLALVVIWWVFYFTWVGIRTIMRLVWV